MPSYVDASSDHNDTIGWVFTWSQFSAIDVHNPAGGRDALRRVTDAAKRVFHALQRDDVKDDVGRQVEILNALIAFATEIPG